MPDDRDSGLKKTGKAANFARDVLVKGQKGWHEAGGKNFEIRFPEATTTVVNIIDKTPRASQATQILKAQNRLNQAAKSFAKAQKAEARANAALQAASAAEEAASAAAEVAKTAERVGKAATRVKNAKEILTVAEKGTPVLRLDTPHGNVNFNHININKDVSGIRDPHIKISSSTLEAGTGTAKFCKVMNNVNKVAVPVAIAIDAAIVGYNVVKDVRNGTSRNTVEAVATTAGGWGGGFGGALSCAAIGTAVFPGVGTIIGGIAGGLLGGITGSWGAGAAVNGIGDAYGYNIEERECKKCGQRFKVRLYAGEGDRLLCPKCCAGMLKELLRREIYSNRPMIIQISSNPSGDSNKSPARITHLAPLPRYDA